MSQCDSPQSKRADFSVTSRGPNVSVLCTVMPFLNLWKYLVAAEEEAA